MNGNALATLRTNEIVLSSNGRWELREFVLSPTTGFLQETTVKETPDLGFNGSQTFADFVNQNASAIIAEVPGATGVVPAQFRPSYRTQRRRLRQTRAYPDRRIAAGNVRRAFVPRTASDSRGPPKARRRDLRRVAPDPWR